MSASKVHVETLRTLEPIASLPEARLKELAGLCHLETIAKDSDPFVARSKGQAIYLLRGELLLTFPDGSAKVLVGGAERSRYPLAARGEVFTRAKTITEVDVLRVDDDVLDVMATWDQIAASEAG